MVGGGLDGRLSVDSRGVTMSRIHRQQGEMAAGYLLVAPVVILFAITRVIPALWAFYLSFTDYALQRQAQWVGLANYQSAFGDAIFMQSLKNTMVYAFFTTVLSTAIALAVAMALDMRIRGSRWLGLAYFAPVVISVVAVSSVWVYILNPQFGIMNYFLSGLGLPPLRWLNDRSIAMPTVIGIGIWQNIGYSAMVYLAALQAVPTEIKEAAIIDGASGWRVFRRITWPLLLPTTALLLILTGLATLQAFDQIVVLTDGGPANSTTTAVHQIYRNAFLFLKLGKAAAMSFILFAILLVLSLIAFRYSRREVRY